jgi:hypothetical protein
MMEEKCCLGEESDDDLSYASRESATSEDITIIELNPFIELLLLDGLLGKSKRSV